MAYRTGRDAVYEERDSFYREAAPPPRRSREEINIYERKEERTRPSSPRGRGFGGGGEFEERDTQVRIRERSVDRDSRVPAFMRDEGRRSEPGALVLRQRDVETVERPRQRPRSPSPIRYQERLPPRPRSLSPPPRQTERDRVEIHDRVIERQRMRSPSRGPSMDRVRIVERERERSPSPPRMPMVRRVVEQRERERHRSPSPPEREREIRIIERERERVPSPSPSPPPPPPEPLVIRGPTIEREVITHYRDIDHGVIVARPPSPPPPPPPQPRRSTREHDIDIDIHTGRHHTDIDIHESSRERRHSPSRERPTPAPPRRALPPPRAQYDDEVIVRSDRHRLEVDIEEHRRGGERRSHSAAPPRRNDYYDDDDEGEYITSRINERGRHGEARHGSTRDWTIVDVPPGTERVHMDGAGGGGADVTWSKYSGVRRAKFVPEREGGAPLAPPQERKEPRDRGNEHSERLSVQVYDKHREVDVEKVTDRRISLRSPAPPPAPPSQKRSEMWTEITKDLVVREAMDELGYEYEETEWFYYVMQYLRYEDVLELVQISDRIRRARKDRLREIQWEREDRIERDRRQKRKADRDRHRGHYDDERIYEHEVIYDRSVPLRGYR